VIEFLLVAGFIAGFVDAIVGGGGLVQLPAFLIAFPNLPLTTILGTNKLASMCGTAVAVWKYQRSIRFNLRIYICAIICALLGSFAGASLTSIFDPSFLRPFVIVLLILAWLFFYFRPDLGNSPERLIADRVKTWRAALIGLSIGIYDGFFGPGTGTLFIIASVSLLGLPFLSASALAKVLNLATNFAALISFASIGAVDWKLGGMVAVSNVLGSYVGAKLALTKGSKFVRIVFLVVVAGLIVKLCFTN
jgi:uncharacterized protein